MSSSGKGDANSYWPGFVDALTNVVIAMIFVVVVLAISLSFAARLMGVKLAEQYIKEHKEKAATAAPSQAIEPTPAAAAGGGATAGSAAGAGAEAGSGAGTGAAVATAAKATLAPTPEPPPDAGVQVMERIAVAGNEKQPTTARPTTVRKQDQVLQLDYAPGALTLDSAAVDQFKQVLSTLQGQVEGRRVQIVASGPDMAFSDNQRAAYVRVMAVRNLLIEAGFAPERIGMELDVQRQTSTTSVNLSFSNAP